MLHTHYKLLYVCLLLLFPTSLYAQNSASILSHKLRSYGEYALGSGGGEGITFHLDFAVTGMQYKTGRVIIYFYDNEDRPMKGQDGYSTTNGSLCVSKEYRATYESTKFTDFQINMPYTKFGIWNTQGDNGGHRIIKCLITVWSENTQLTSQWVAFYYYQDSWTLCSSCSGTKRCRGCYGQGTTSFYSGGLIQYRICPLCNGTGVCQGCGGKGGWVAASFNETEMKHSQEPY